MHAITSWTRRHRLAAFFTLTFAISWWVWPFYEIGVAPTPFFACGPLVAALSSSESPRDEPGTGLSAPG